MKYRLSWSEILLRLILGIGIATCTWLLITEPSQAGDLYIAAAIGAYGNGNPGPVNVKYGEIGYRGHYACFLNQISGGGWVQVHEGDGRKSSAFVSDQIGVQADTGDLVARFATGPAFISTPDSFLGGNFQFHETLFVGLKDSIYGNEIGVEYQHFSSAGFEMPNKGRDFLGLEISF